MRTRIRVQDESRLSLSREAKLEIQDRLDFIDAWLDHDRVSLGRDDMKRAVERDGSPISSLSSASPLPELRGRGVSAGFPLCASCAGGARLSGDRGGSVPREKSPCVRRLWAYSTRPGIGRWGWGCMVMA